MNAPSKKNAGTCVRTSRNAQVYELATSCSYGRAAKYWRPTSVDATSMARAYVEVRNYYYYTHDRKREHPAELRYICQLLGRLGISTPIYGIRTSDLQRIVGDASWTLLWKYIRRELAKRHAEYEEGIAGMRDWMYAYYLHDDLSCMYDCQFASWSKCGELIRRLRRAHKAVEDRMVQAYWGLALKAGYLEPLDGSEMRKLHEDVLATYPLLRHVDWWGIARSSSVGSIIDYITMIDTRRGGGTQSQPSGSPVGPTGIASCPPGSAN